MQEGGEEPSVMSISHTWPKRTFLILYTNCLDLIRCDVAGIYFYLIIIAYQVLSFKITSVFVI